MIKIYVNQAWKCFHVSPFEWIVRSVDDNFPSFWWFWVKKRRIFAWFQMKLLKLGESAINRNSQYRIEVKSYSVKCWKLLSSLNFPWTWIHWQITTILKPKKPETFAKVLFLNYSHFFTQNIWAPCSTSLIVIYVKLPISSHT